MSNSVPPPDAAFKDAVLDRLAQRANVAQFVSFGPDLRLRYHRLHEDAAGRSEDDTPASAAAALLRASPEGLVNIRTFLPGVSKSLPFEKWLSRAEDVAARVRHFAASGLYAIVNETVNEKDGGVSGVALGDVLEFAPDDTPRCVERPGVASLPRGVGLRLLERVYQFRPTLDYPPGTRVEFSLHPLKRGFRHDHTIIWELEEFGAQTTPARLAWPNRFSRLVGDKAFGLLVADAVGLPVPNTIAVPRRLAPFRFGRPTGTGEFWLRTCPVEQVPGRFTTHRGWLDPFALLQKEDPEGAALASVLCQEGVDAWFSGAALIDPEDRPLIEGVRGRGDDFMVGTVGPERLPSDVVGGVRALLAETRPQLGPVRVEWVADAERVWVVQMHAGRSATSGLTIYPGTPRSYRRFDTKQGLEPLRALVAEVQRTGEGVILVGDIGVTSHMGDVLRKAGVPSRVEPPAG